MKLIGVVRLGRDAEVRFTAGGDPVMSFSGVFNYGKKDQNSGERPSQWVDFSMWGKRAETLSQYMKKGSRVFVSCSEAHIETFKRKEGADGVKLAARVDDVELLGDGKPAEEKQARPAPPKTHGQQKAEPRSFADMDDDIPF